MAKLYANENFPLPVVEELRLLGHDVLTVQETGKGNLRIPDAGVLAFAVQEKRAVLTLNRRDFIRLHAQQPTHHGIVVCTEDADFGAMRNESMSRLAKQASLLDDSFECYGQSRSPADTITFASGYVSGPMRSLI